jgi:hypothetical protein
MSNKKKITGIVSRIKFLPTSILITLEETKKIFIIASGDADLGLASKGDEIELLPGDSEKSGRFTVTEIEEFRNLTLERELIEKK